MQVKKKIHITDCNIVYYLYTSISLLNKFKFYEFTINFKKTILVRTISRLIIHSLWWDTFYGIIKNYNTL